MQVKLFHVFSAVPESYWDLEKEPRSIKAIKHVRAWESQQRKEIRNYMDKARQILLSAGFADEKVAIDIHDKKKGVARDIIKEAHGYDVVVSRRRGLGIVRGITMGSVATKLLEKISFTPIVVSGRKIPNKKVLIALDGSEASMRAVDFVGELFGNYAGNIGLLHVIRGIKNKNLGYMPLFTPENFIEKRAKETGSVLDEARRRLVASGFKPNQLKAHIITGSRSRAAVIAEEAKRGNYLRIILGRRGLSKPDKFSMGRVTYKVIQLAKECAVWVIP
jgi:nucleotide-binding universal stress UspA family protein